MQISASYIDDFKTARKDLLPPLPMPLRVVPILFYGAVLFLVAIGILASLHKKSAVERVESAQQRLSDMKSEIAGLENTEKNLATEISEARDMEAWVLASMPVQPLIVNIMRSMKSDSSVVRLSLERDPENPAQLKLELRMKADSDAQLEETLSVIRNDKATVTLEAVPDKPEVVEEVLASLTAAGVNVDGESIERIAPRDGVVDIVFAAKKEELENAGSALKALVAGINARGMNQNLPARLSYVEIAPTQTREADELEYRATLVWFDPRGEEAQSPDERAAQVITP